MRLDELNVFKISMVIGDRIWGIVYNWKYFERQTIGFQLTRAVDSIAANLSEGYGRFSFKENKQFCYYSRGSLYETVVWLKKARSRDLIKETEYKEIVSDLKDLSVKLNNYIKSLGKKDSYTMQIKKE